MNLLASVSKWKKRMQNSLSWVHVLHRILNLLISRCSVLHWMAKKCIKMYYIARTYKVIVLPHWVYCFVALPLPSSLFKFPFQYVMSDESLKPSDKTVRWMIQVSYEYRLTSLKHPPLNNPPLNYVTWKQKQPPAPPPMESETTFEWITTTLTSTGSCLESLMLQSDIQVTLMPYFRSDHNLFQRELSYAHKIKKMKNW